MIEIMSCFILLLAYVVMPTARASSVALLTITAIMGVIQMLLFKYGTPFEIIIFPVIMVAIMIMWPE